MDARRKYKAMKKENSTLYVMALTLFIAWTTATPCDAASAKSNEQSTTPHHDASYIYYPATAEPYYDYQSSGAFANRPMVLPPTLPIVTQPAYLYTTAPTPTPSQIQLPIISTQAPDDKSTQTGDHPLKR